MPTEHLVVRCPSLVHYAEVAATDAAIPILAGAGTDAGDAASVLPPGFPAGVAVVDHGRWGGGGPAPGAATDHPPGHGGVCVSAPEAHCVAVARLLADRTGRRLVVLAPDPTLAPDSMATLAPDSMATDATDSMATDATGAGDGGLGVAAAGALEAGATSLCFVVPCWDPATGAPASTWLRRCLDVMRTIDAAAPGVSWGMVTATDPVDLSLLAARTLVAPLVAEERRDLPTAFVTDLAPDLLRTPFAHVGAGVEAPVLQIDGDALADGRAAALVHDPWSALVVRTHARNYCGVAGHLCGARRPQDPPTLALAGCIMGMDCYDASFPQVDPRCYDAPVVVFDSCSTGSWAARAWEAGAPPLAVLTLAGPAASVIASAGPTMDSEEHFAEVFAALGTAATMGAATARLNGYRPMASTRLAYYLFGDPEAPAGPTRWPRWTEQVAVGADGGPTAVPARRFVAGPTPPGDHSATGAGAPFRWARLPAAPRPGQALYAHDGAASPGPEPALGWVTAFHPADQPGAVPEGECVVWWPAATAGAAAPTAARPVFDLAPVPRLPVGLAEEARSLAAETAGWTEVLADAAAGLHDAARAVAVADRVVGRADAAVVAGPPAAVTDVVRWAMDRWMQAHAAAVRTVREQAPGALWPLRFWGCTPSPAHLAPGPCPACGLSPIVERTYDVVPGVARRWRECERCGDFIDDLPVADRYPRLSLHGPIDIDPSAPIEVRLEVDHTDPGPGAVDCLGVGFVVVDMAVDKHGVTAAPEIFALQCARGQRASATVQLSLAGPPPVAHLYRIRALVLVNGRWFWLSRPLGVWPTRATSP